MLELLEWWDCRLEPREEHIEVWDEDTLDSLNTITCSQSNTDNR